ncbi:cell division protein FtsQ/DivIB, partial [Kineococcus glutinatus]|uniref:cell division protein FtsQ/DivIB n=1 Tax=Kineococcus glutinatus TaxID=1070872 RepID=UPI0031E61ADC
AVLPRARTRAGSRAGTERTAAAEVAAITDGVRGTQLVRVDTGGIAERVARLPLVAGAEVERRWPSTLVVHVRERQAVAALPDGPDGYRVVDGDGTVLTRTSQVPTDVPSIDVDVDAAGAPTLRAALQVMRGLPSWLRSDVRDISAASPESVVLTLADGRVVRWGSAERSERKAEVLRALLDAGVAAPPDGGDGEGEGKGDAAVTIDVSAPEHPAVQD